MSSSWDLWQGRKAPNGFTLRRIQTNIANAGRAEKHLKMQSASGEFPTVDLVEGGMTPDGQALLLQLSTAERGPVQLSLRLADLESFVTFLLRMAARAQPPEASDDRVRYQPIPVSGVSAGELADGMGCLGVTVGGTELMFQIPLTALSEVAQTLLLVGAAEQTRRPS
jgi:hypothetical protein